MAADLPKKISVIVPCYNEEENLRRLFPDLLPRLRGLGCELELVLVDDGSKDGTFHAMGDLVKKHPFIKIFRHSKNLGLGATLRTGFSLASGDAVVTLDSDMTFHPDEIPRLLAAYGPRVDCVMGSAFTGRMQGVHPVRRLLSWGVNWIYGRLLGKNFTAVSAVFRLYRASALKALKLQSNSFDINAEILYKLLASGAGVVEVPVTLGRRAYGVSKINVQREIRNHLKMFFRIMKWKLGSSIS